MRGFNNAQSGPEVTVTVSLIMSTYLPRVSLEPRGYTKPKNKAHATLNAKNTESIHLLARPAVIQLVPDLYILSLLAAFLGYGLVTEFLEYVT